jgi:hypothetical protein
MTRHSVTLFAVYPFHIGQKIRVQDGPRSGDWEVIGISERKVVLRCPVSGREFEWNRFCYFTEEKKQEWPQSD